MPANDSKGCAIQCSPKMRYSTDSVGQYMSTKIFDFIFYCFKCSNKLVIRTDPKNCDYELHEGCVKKVTELLDRGMEAGCRVAYNRA